MARNRFDQDEEVANVLSFTYFKRLLGYVKPHRRLFFITLSLMILATVASLTGPILFKIALDSVIPNRDVRGLLFLAFGFLGITLVVAVSSRFRTLYMSYMGNEIVRSMRHDIFSKLQRLGFPYFDGRPHGKIIIRVINYVGSVSDLISTGLIGVVSDALSLFFIVGFMLAINVKLTLLSMAGLPFLWLIAMVLRRVQKRHWQTVSSKNSNLVAYLAESVNGMRVTQSFNRQSVNTGIFRALNEDFKRSWLKACLVSGSIWPLIENVNFFSSALLYMGAIYWFQEGVTVGVIIVFLGYVGRFWGPINSIGEFYNGLVQTAAYVERVFETIDEPVDIANDAAMPTMSEITGTVEFRDVVFRYRDQKEETREHESARLVLKKVSFMVKAGETVALVGPTGSGKTTIANLIPRYYDPEGGAVLVDGMDVSTVNLGSLREQIGIMPQDTFLFTGTVRENIRYGSLMASDEEIERVARCVCADDFIRRLPQGYESHISEGGGNFSAGEKQLICFARALLANPRILILDEATAGVDSATEEALQRGLRYLLQGRTGFVIAHRLSTIRDADTIFYLEAGEIAESGNHATLMALKGRYYRQVMGAGA